MADQLLGIEILLHAEAVTGRAGARRVVEGEQARFQLGQRIATHRAGEARGEDEVFLFAIHEVQARAAVGQVQRGLEGFGQTLLEVFAHLEAIDDDVDVMLLVLLQRLEVIQLDDHAVDACTHEALSAQL